MAGAEIVEDAVAFFQAFEGMEDGFRTRAGAVRELLADPATAYVLVTSARPDAIAEATYFAERLAERDIVVAALVVNRMAPFFGPGTTAARRPLSRGAGGRGGALEALEHNLRQLNTMAAREEAAFACPGGQGGARPRSARIPLFGHDVHELDGLRRAADWLMG